MLYIYIYIYIYIHDVYKATKTRRGKYTKISNHTLREPNQSVKSNNDIEPSPMYNLTQSQNRYKKEFLIV